MERLNKSYCIDQMGMDPKVFELPIKAVQFGTGVLLRGLIDYIFQKSNEQGFFNGRVAMVKSTSPDIREFLEQDGVFTVVETGLNARQETHLESYIICCVNPIWSATQDEDRLKNLFASEQLELVVSNVTELGLVYEAEKITGGLPHSYPGKLTALLYHRYLKLKGSADSGLIIIPTELLIDNGLVLKSMVIRHAVFNQLPAGFVTWLNECCDFCDSLVDRIVPGKMAQGIDGFNLPYADHLTVQTEPYFLWAIQGNSKTRQKLKFAEHIPGMVITEDIQPYREQKLRLLNGGHTILSPLAYLLGCRNVEQMMVHEQLSQFLSQTCENEILPSLESFSSYAEDFYQQMKLRWLNPFLDHPLKSILTQSTTKMQSRNGDTFVRYFEANKELPGFLSFGFAAYLFLFRPHHMKDNLYFALDLQGNEFEITDQKAEYLFQHWSPYFNQEKTIAETIDALLGDSRIFDHPFIDLPEFKGKMAFLVQIFQETGIAQPLLTLLNAVPHHA